MLLTGVRITTPWRVRSPLRSLSHCLRFNFTVSCSSGGECDDFLPWLERKAGMKVSSVLSIGKSAYGRSLFASKTIKKGDRMLRIPYDAKLAQDNLLPEIRALISDEVGINSKVALVVLVEQHKGQDSEWAPYISLLPQLGEIHSPILWSEDELDMIRSSSVYQETIKQKAKIEKDYMAIMIALERFPEISKSITLEDFMRAYSLVASRAWESSKGVSLIPFADFLNHDRDSDSIVMSDDDKQISKLIADRNYAPGEEVFISYGKVSNATLLLDYGFTLPDNNNDKVKIHMDIPHHDSLLEMKLNLLRQHRVPTKKDVNAFDISENSFTIKEVKSARGNGKGLPQSLRAFARVLCCSSTQELCDLAIEASQNDGRLARRPLKDRTREIQAHKMLLSHITQLIETHDTAIKSLDRANCSSSCDTLVFRRQMARELLNGELRVLKSAAAWLESYCESLFSSIPLNQEGR